MVAFTFVAPVLALLAAVSATPINADHAVERRGTTLRTDILLQHGNKSWVVGLRRLEQDNCQWAASYTFETAEEVPNPDGLKAGLVKFHYTADDGFKYEAVPIGDSNKMDVQYNGKSWGSCTKAEELSCTSDVNNSWYAEKPWVCTVEY